MVEIKVGNRSFGVHVVLLPFSLTIHSIFHSTFWCGKATSRQPQPHSTTPKKSQDVAVATFGYSSARLSHRA